jgi:hypothetical protein
MATAGDNLKPGFMVLHDSSLFRTQKFEKNKYLPYS